MAEVQEVVQLWIKPIALQAPQQNVWPGGSRCVWQRFAV